MKPSRYNIAHALAATALLLYVVFHQGFAVFWHQFVHGFGLEMTPENLFWGFLSTAGLFGTMTLLLWISTFFVKPMRSPTDAEVPKAMPLRNAVMFAMRWAPLMIGIAFGLNLLCSAAIEHLAGVQPSDQELVKCLAGDACPTGLRILIGLLVLFEAPLLEEPLFRGIMFRGFASAIPTWAAMAISGFLFALVHVNAATFVPLWFLGVAFAAIYRRTGTIVAPMVAHALFNATNLALLPFLPQG